MDDLLENIVWNTLNGRHAKYATGSGGARRYAPGFSPIVGFADPLQPDFDALAPHCAPGERFYSVGWSGPAPAGWADGWQLEADSTMFRMVWSAAMPDTPDAPDAAEAPAMITLDNTHAPQAIELAALTRPGPFGARTTELGAYIGCFDGPHLVAMAGERMHAGALREISGVCTHPQQQGRGLARRLMLELVRREMLRGELPFLHVMRDNTAARRLYERMGFTVHGESAVRVVARR